MTKTGGTTMSHLKDRKKHDAMFFFRQFAAPRQTMPYLRNREVVLTTLIVISISFSGVLLFLLGLSAAMFNDAAVWGRFAACLMAIGILLVLYLLARNRRFKASAIGLIAMFGLIAFGMVFVWGGNLPLALLLLGFTIILSGILMGSRAAVYSTVMVIAILLVVQAIKTAGWYAPNEDWLTSQVHWGDIIANSILLVAIGFVSWLYGWQNERWFQRSQTAENELRKEHALLESKIKERTVQLRLAQFKEMQQFYRFAEMGHLSAAMLHDLANHLTVLTFNIDDLSEFKHSAAIMRARQSIHYLEEMIERVSSRLNNPGKTERFSVSELISESMTLFAGKARDAHVKLQYQPAEQPQMIEGDRVQLSQALGVLITNAIEAYDDDRAKRLVVIASEHKQSRTLITVTDFGSGISKAGLAHLFEPFQTTKAQGMGIGLFIAKGMIKTSFKGALTVKSGRGQTAFIISLPDDQAAHARKS